MRVIVSLTTIPKRLEHVHIVIANICKQTRLPTYVCLYLPTHFSRTGEPYVIPDSLQQLEIELGGRFQIHVVKEDKGPITKIAYALQTFRDPNDVIISVDDDILYHDHFVEELLQAHLLQPRALLGFMGNDPPLRPHIHAESLPVCKEEPVFEKVITLGGYRGILYPRAVIGPHFFQFLDELHTKSKEVLRTCIQEDDNFIAQYCKHMKIPMFVISTQFPGDLQSNDLLKRVNFQFLATSKIDALYGSEHSAKMMPSMELLVSYYQSHKLTARQ